MIQASGIVKTFRTETGEVKAVDNASLTVNPGDFVIIMGRSGSGKSTLLAILGGLLQATSGSVTINGSVISDLAEDRVAGIRAREIGFVFQFSGLIPTLTALENVLLPTLFCPPVAGSRERGRRLLETVGLSEREDAYPSTLSSGEMKRVAIARAMINRPSFIIADEPTGDLDVETEIEIMELFRNLNREGTTIIMVTHSPDLVPFATRIYGMYHGRLQENPSIPCAGIIPRDLNGGTGTGS